MELSAPLMQLLATLGLPVWLLIPLTAVLTLVLKRRLPDLKLPKLPSPSPAPTPTPEPIPDSPILPNRPVLDALLRLLLKLRSTGDEATAKIVGELVEQEVRKS